MEDIKNECGFFVIYYVCSQSRYKCSIYQAKMYAIGTWSTGAKPVSPESRELSGLVLQEGIGRKFRTTL